METPKMEYRETWTGKHLGIPFEVQKYTPTYSDHPIWTFYVFIRVEMIPAEHRAKFFVEKDMEKPHYARYDWSKTVLTNLDKWHSGMTFYSIEGDGECVKAGCDYNHYWDEGHWFSYTEKTVEFDARALIDELRREHPYLLVRCNYNGNYYPSEVMAPYGDGYISPEGTKAKDEYAAKHAAKVPQ